MSKSSWSCRSAGCCGPRSRSRSLPPPPCGSDVPRLDREARGGDGVLLVARNGGDESPIQDSLCQDGLGFISSGAPRVTIHLRPLNTVAQLFQTSALEAKRAARHWRRRSPWPRRVAVEQRNAAATPGEVIGGGDAGDHGLSGGLHHRRRHGAPLQKSKQFCQPSRLFCRVTLMDRTVLRRPA